MASKSRTDRSIKETHRSQSKKTQLQEVNEAWLRVMFVNTVRGLVLDRGISNEYFDLDVLKYKDVDKTEKIAVFVAFVQDFKEHDESLEVTVLSELVKQVKDLKLQNLVNDISVNALQWRDKKVSRRTLGG